MKITPVILSGGRGTRLWPLSRDLYPKQYLKLSSNENSLLQNTLLRLKGIETQDTYIICNEAHRFLVAEQLKAIQQEATIFLEPIGRNTAPAIALVAMEVIKKNTDGILFVLPADHIIENDLTYLEDIAMAYDYAFSDHLVTFGIRPTKPETGYGYIEVKPQTVLQKAYAVEKFVEKPDLETAKNYLKSGNYFWNSGMFVFRASQFLTELKKYSLDIYQSCQEVMEKNHQDGNCIYIDKESFSLCREDSIDYAVMEHTQKAITIPLSCQWSDVGSWPSLHEAQPKNPQGNTLIGDVVADQLSNSYVHATDRLVVAVGLEDAIIVETADAVLVTQQKNAALLKDVVSLLKTKNRVEVESHRKVYRPWGSFETLIEGSHFKVKHIIVNPGESLSLQLHHQRSEHWVVVQGQAEVTCGENTFILHQNQSTYIPLKTKHRLYNPDSRPLEIIEVQSGEYLGEDDIVRFSDNYGRCKW